MRYLIIISIISLFSTHILSQYKGGDFVISDEEKRKRYDVETIEELLVDLQAVLSTVIVGDFPIRRTDCLTKKLRPLTHKAFLLVQKVAPLMPENYRIVIIGHADKKGRDVSAKGDHGNDYWSAMRAKCVADYIIRNDSDIAEKMLMGGKGSKLNKRIVTLKILAYKDAIKLHKKLIRRFKW